MRSAVSTVVPRTKHRVRLMVVWTALAIIAGTVVTGTGPHAGDEKARRFTFLSITWVARIHSVIVWIAVLMALSLLWHLRADAPRSRGARRAADAVDVRRHCAGRRRLPPVRQRGAGGARRAACGAGNDAVGDVGVAVVRDVESQRDGAEHDRRVGRRREDVQSPRLRTNSASLSTAEAKNEPIELMKLTVASALPDGSCHRRITKKATKR